MEMYAITTVVTLVYLLPYLYEKPVPYQFAASAIMILLFYFSTYMLYGVTRVMLRKNRTLEELNNKILKLSSLATELLGNLVEGSPESFSESLKDHVPSTYCLIMLFDDKLNLIPRIACSVRTIAWDPAIGTAYHQGQLIKTRKIFETGEPAIYRLESDGIDDELKSMLPANTRSLLAVPVRTGTDGGGVAIFGEERQWKRAPFTHEKIKLAMAISNQVAAGVRLRICHERLDAAKLELEHSRDAMIKAERLSTLGEVTRAVEHEINNPLNVIANWSEIYREDPSIGPELRKKFQIIYEMSIRITEVIRKLAEVKDAKSIEFITGQRMTDIK